MSPDDRDVTAALPAVWQGHRRVLLSTLAGTGFVQAAAATAASILTPRLLHTHDPRQRAVLAAVLAVLATLVAILRWAERVLAEKLGQDYVIGLRRRLLAAALAPNRGPNLGITVARTTNDLTAVRNWIALGIAPLISGIPLVVGVLVGLWFLSRPLGMALSAVVAVLAVVLLVMSRPTLRRSRELRRRRGQMAARIADTVGAAEMIRASGGQRRELRRIDALSEKVADAAVARAWAAGVMRGAAAGAPLFGMIAVGIAGAAAAIDSATMTTGLILIGVLASPLVDLGRVSEYRQAYSAARLVLAPALVGTSRSDHGRRYAASQAAEDWPGDSEGQAEPSGPGHVRLSRLKSPSGPPLPPLIASAGTRVVARTDDPARARLVLDLLTGDLTAPWSLMVDGRELAGRAPDARAPYIGFALGGRPLPVGSVERCVRYRCPKTDDPVEPLLAAVGLAERVAELPSGAATVLRRGGEPLTTDERTRLQVARSLYRNPPLIVLDQVATQLDAAGVEAVRAALAAYPGVVLAFGDRTEALLADPVTWDLDAPPRLALRPHLAG